MYNLFCQNTCIILPNTVRIVIGQKTDHCDRYIIQEMKRQLETPRKNTKLWKLKKKNEPNIQSKLKCGTIVRKVE